MILLSYHRDRMSASRMALSISDSMHIDFLKYLTITYKGPLSLIVDGTTDLTQMHQFALIIRAVKDGIPRDYFYHLIELKSEQDAVCKVEKMEWQNKPI